MTIQVNKDFTNHPIHLWDAVWGWEPQGHNMFRYQGGVNAPATPITVPIPTADASGSIDLTNVLIATYGGSQLATFGAGGDTFAVANAQTILTAMAGAKIDLSDKNKNITVSVQQFPLTTDFAALINTPTNAVTKIRIFNAGTNYSRISGTGKITTIPILSVTGDITQAVYVNLDTATDSITYTSNDGNLTIRLNNTKANGVTNQYTVTGADVGSLNTNGVTFTPIGNSNAADGTTFTFLGVPFSMGSVKNLPVLPTSTTICFQRGTKILTPNGYKSVEELLAGDLLINTQNGTIPINSMIKFIGKKEEGALYCLPKDSLKKNKPLNDLYMSGDHAFKHNGIWRHMNCASGEKFPEKQLTYQTEQDDIEYYHIIIDDYFAHTIIAEGVEVETCFEDKDDGVIMAWSCNEKCCTPMKHELNKPMMPAAMSTKMPMRQAPPKKNVLSMLNTIPRKIKPAILDSEAYIQLLENKKTVKKSMMVWKYDRKLERNTAVQCHEINLPN
jgi:hypothetical protein